MAAAVLFKIHGSCFLDLKIPFVQSRDPKKLSFLCQMMEKNLNSPLTSSAGRLFDGVSSLLGICHFISYESQAAMVLEAAAAGSGVDGNDNRYSFDLIEAPPKAFPNDFPYYEVDMMPCIREIVQDVRFEKRSKDISQGFHATLVRAFVAAACRVGIDTGIKNVVLSGGVFNNNLVLNQAILGLENQGFAVFTHTKVPTGDGGISLGQALVAASQNFETKGLG
jgi:hydrogenase maturation protein HypF